VPRSQIGRPTEVGGPSGSPVTSPLTTAYAPEPTFEAAKGGSAVGGNRPLRAARKPSAVSGTEDKISPAATTADIYSAGDASRMLCT